MIEVVGNLWEYPADVRVITTNGTVKKNGECVMGRGCALEAKQRFPTISGVLGDALRRGGNHVYWLYGGEHGAIIFSFPVKHEWHQKADIDLIRQSAEEISGLIPKWIKVVVMPRPGCGNGGLTWCACQYPDDAHADGCGGVRHVLEPILDDRFHVITFARS